MNAEYDALAARLLSLVEDIEDSLGREYHLQASVELLDGEERAKLVWKRSGTPASWCIFIDYSGTAVKFSSASLRWRCVAVGALGRLCEALNEERRAAMQRLAAAVDEAEAFRQHLPGGSP